MSDLDFYNHNLYRNYPAQELEDGAGWGAGITQDVFRKLIVDMGVVIYDDCEFDIDLGSVKLESVTKNYDLGIHDIYYWVRIDNGTTVIADAIEYSNVQRSFVVINKEIEYDGKTIAHVWIVTGDADTIYNLPSTTHGVYLPIEPALIQIQKGHCVTKFVVANDPRTVADSCGSSSEVTDYSILEIAPRGESIIEDVVFKEGQNCSITVNKTLNTIRFSGKKGAGTGLACEEIPKTTYEETLIDNLEEGQTIRLDNSSSCFGGVTNINGVIPDEAGHIELVAGDGIQITYPDAHTIRITAATNIESCT